MTAGLEEHFKRYGFIHIKGVLKAEEIAALRQRLFEIHEDEEARLGHRVKGLASHITLNTPELYRLPFKEEIVRSLKAILEPHFTLLPDLSYAKNQIGLSGGKNPGWHWDASSEGKQSYLYAPDYRFVKCGLYLQENTEDYGGGVDIVPGRHRWPLRTGNTNLNYKAKNLLDIIGMRFRGTMVKLEPGDFLAFHSCLPHRSTLPRKLLADVTAEDVRMGAIAAFPMEKTKFTIYWDACRRKSLDGYWNNLARRANDELDDAQAIKFPSVEYVSLKYPEDYPADFVAMAKMAGVNVASFDEEGVADFRRRYKRRLAATL